MFPTRSAGSSSRSLVSMGLLMLCFIPDFREALAQELQRIVFFGSMQYAFEDILYVSKISKHVINTGCKLQSNMYTHSFRETFADRSKGRYCYMMFFALSNAVDSGYATPVS